MSDLLRPPVWQDDALCAQTDPGAFFPEDGSSAVPAKRICRMCEVRDECLNYAIENHLEHGIWGGLSVRERRPLQRAHLHHTATTILDQAA